MSKNANRNLNVMNPELNIAVVIPCFKVKNHILSVLKNIGPEVNRIIVIDDKCPELSGQFVANHVTDPRVVVLYHEKNRGVGGAVMTGYQAALEDGANIIIKLDGDGQMNPALIPSFIDPILMGEADYTKGNRFFDLEQIKNMPGLRLFGNAVLSLITKISSGYWDLFDPTNGFTAIHADVAAHLPFHKISQRYFFETDILFRLNTIRAVVVDIPMDATYGQETSNLKISKIVGEFLIKHVRNFSKRIFYNYYLRDLSLASIELPLGLLLIFTGAIFGLHHWLSGMKAGVVTSAGTVMLAALPILSGLQFLLAFLGYDIAQVPRRPLHSRMRAKEKISPRVSV